MNYDIEQVSHNAYLKTQGHLKSDFFLYFYHSEFNHVAKKIVEAEKIITDYLFFGEKCKFYPVF